MLYETGLSTINCGIDISFSTSPNMGIRTTAHVELVENSNQVGTIREKISAIEFSTRGGRQLIALLT